MDVREATPDDAGAASAVAEDAWWASCAAFLDADTLGQVISDGYSEDRLAGAFEDDELHAVVAVDDRVLGFAIAERTWADTVDLHALYVDPDRWGEGVGAALLDSVLAYAREEGCSYLRAMAFLDNPVARPFFESQGFERTGTVETPVFGTVHEEAVLEREV